MASFTYDLMWREAMMELLEQLEAENPEDAALAPKELSDWAVLYLRYLQIVRKLEAAYDQMLQPQKRQAMRRALEAALGRLLEVRHWMVALNRGLDFAQLDELVVDLKLTPDALEVPVPRYFIENRAQEIRDRDKFLQVLLDKYSQQAAADAAAAAGADAAGAAVAAAAVAGVSASASAAAAAGACRIDIGPTLPLEEAVAVVIRNERGRQARERARLLAAAHRSRAAEEGRRAPLSRDEAARKIQAALRGHLWRQRVKREAQQELVFVGMRPQAVDPKSDPQAVEARHLLTRKQQLLDPEHGSLRKYDDAIVELKAKVKEQEGEDMREAIQDKINAWFIANRTPAGEYPDLPSAAQGGSKPILNPTPPSMDQLLAAGAAAPGSGASAKQQQAQQRGGSSAKPGIAKPAGGDKAAAGKGAAAAGKRASSGAGGAGATCEVAAAGSAFIPLLEAALSEYVAVWQERPVAAGGDAGFDAELLKDELRPLVFEEVRQTVDEEMRVLLANLKALVAAEAAAKAGKKAKKTGKKGDKKEKGAKEGKAKKGKGDGDDKAKKGGKKKGKDPTADRSMESLFAELASNGVLAPLPRAELADFLGGLSLLGATLERAGVIPDASLAQIRSAVTEFGILPLGIQLVHERVPHVRSLLLYGAHQTGKTMLAHAIAHLSGACLFDLSPRNTDGRYPGKAAAMLLHMVFKLARCLAPSVILIEEAEKVFVSDKKRAKELGGQEPYSRIKKDLLREVKALKPGERVLVVGTSAEPWLAAKKDEATFRGFWSKSLHLPLPDYAARRLIWPGLFARHGGRLPYDFDVSTLALLSDGYAAGALDAVVASLLASPARRERLRAHPVDVQEVLRWLCMVQPVPREVDVALHKWGDGAPALAAIKGVAAATAGGGDKASTGKKGGKAGAATGSDKKAGSSSNKKKK